MSDENIEVPFYIILSSVPIENNSALGLSSHMLYALDDMMKIAKLTATQSKTLYKFRKEYVETMRKQMA